MPQTVITEETALAVIMARESRRTYSGAQENFNFQHRCCIWDAWYLRRPFSYIKTRTLFAH